MLTYSFSIESTTCLYEQLYNFIKNDIQKGILKSGEKLPSKRALSANLGISIITVENAYAQLCAEGYLTSVPKSGFYINSILPDVSIHANEQKTSINSKDWIPPIESQRVTLPSPSDESPLFDFAANRNEPGTFPFSIWAKLMRETLSIDPNLLLRKSPGCGIYDLRESIVNHLSQFRGMSILPEQVVVGAGTEYLYSLLIQLFDSACVYGIENPGYQKIAQIYRSNGVIYHPIPLDTEGVSIDNLRKSDVDVLHISPSHHFPTGLVTTINRRNELLSWAGELNNRYIIEDEYDSEFRLHGRPIPTMQSIDPTGKVIYMNTFSKSLSDTIRISYMILPPKLLDRFYQKLSFYSCTVPVFEQHVLARFLSEGYFDKHINRMRNRNRSKREIMLSSIKCSSIPDYFSIKESDSGLHLLLRPINNYTDQSIRASLQKERINAAILSDYEYTDKNIAHMSKQQTRTDTTIILNYSEIPSDKIPDAIHRLEIAIHSF